ncbi:MAG: hypothetical protein U5R31_08630 [Acidimicrobiia bacterium]|nr:hypothetical protein [Acidimicrobiia bacterium]
MNQPIDFDTPVADGLRASGSLCLKGVSGIQYLYDPYRIHLPLKRTGPRGSGEFEPIAWDQLIEEVVEGGRLFESIGEDREVEGLRALHSTDLIDPDAPELGRRPTRWCGTPGGANRAARSSSNGSSTPTARSTT